MSPLGTQRVLAVLIFLSPWIFVPNPYKDIFYIIAGILLYLSTLDMRKRAIHFPDGKPENKESEQSA